MKKTFLSILIGFGTFVYAYCAEDFNFHNEATKQIQVENYTALNKCYGYVRYFYPNPNFKKIDWVKFLMYAVEKVDSAQTDEDLRVILTTLFQPLCSDIVFSKDSIKSLSKISSPCYAVKHNGIGSYVKIFDKQNTPIILFQNESIYNDVYCYKLKENLYITLPLAVHRLPTKTKNFNLLVKQINKIDMGGTNLMTLLLNRKKIAQTSFLYTKRNYRIADLMMRYNLVQHFYGYYNEDQLISNWDINFKKSLNSVIQIKNKYDYYSTLCKYTSIIQDGHLIVSQDFNLGISWMANPLALKYPNIVYDFIKDTCYVKMAGKEYSNLLSKGDRIIAVNNQPTEKLIQQKLSGNAHSTREMGLYRIADNGNLFETNSRDSIINIVVKDSANQLHEVQLKANLQNPLREKKGNFIKKTDNEVYYIDLCSDSCTYENFKNYYHELETSKGIIFDVRGYPQFDVLAIISHFIDKKIEIGNLTTPIYRFPNHAHVEYETCEKWGVVPAVSSNSKETSKKYGYKTPLPIKIDVPIVFITNARCLSFGESFMEMIKYYGIGKIVGTPTAGCNGDVTKIDIPNCNFYMTYNKFYNRDGSQHHNIGIQPDYYCEMNISDIQNHIDTQLEFAKKILLNLWNN